MPGNSRSEIVPQSEAEPNNGRIPLADTETPAPEKPVKILFYYDANINGKAHQASCDQYSSD